MADQPFKIRRSPALAALGYAAAGTLWILASDGLLRLIVGDPARLSQWQTVTGLTFVAVTTAVPYILLRTVCRKAPPLLRQESSEAGRAGLMLPLAAYLPLILALGFTGYFVFHQQRLQMTRHIEESLSAVAWLKVDQITRWLRKRTADGEVMASNSFLAQEAEKWMAAPTPGAERLSRERLATARERFGYHNVLLLDRRANLRLASAEEPDLVTPEDRQLARQATQREQVVFSDLDAAGPEKRTPRVDFVAPFTVRQGNRDMAIGVLLLRVDPRTFPYPLIQPWPASSNTAETLLVRREGDDVRFLNELRHRSDTALKLRLPMGRPDLSAALAFRGKEGVAEGVDFRSVPVLAAMRPIPGTPWFIVTKIDQAEGYTPINALAVAGGSLLALFTVAAGLVLALWWRQQSLRHAFARYRAEQEREALLRHLDCLSKYANDIIVLVDENGRIVEANDRAAETYGYPREELIGLDARQLRAPEAQTAFEADWKELEERNARIYETSHRHRDGTTFPVEISARVIEVDGRRFRQSIIRDISERKAARSRLEQQLDELLRFQKLTVGRELRMKELVEENRRLQGQLAEALKPGPPR